MTTNRFTRRNSVHPAPLRCRRWAAKSRKDDTPSYQLACVVDDAAMGITEVVRGADLIKSTFRQLLLYRALGLATPVFYHCPLLTDAAGIRLAKRHDALSLCTLRVQGVTPQSILQTFLQEQTE